MFGPVYTFIEGNVPLAWVVLLAAFVVLAKSSDLFVDGAVALANLLRIPKLVIGIVLVAFATTAPELSVSLMSAVRGHPEMALGNAVGSVICNTGLALGLGAVLSAAAVPIIPHVLKSSGYFLVGVAMLCFLFTLGDNALGRGQGLVLLLLFLGYLAYVFRQHKKGVFHDDVDLEAAESHLHMGLPRLLLVFGAGLGGIVVASDFIIVSATAIATSFGIPRAVIALTLVALGTSIPEVATCVAAARKNQGDLAVGNILGANIMNVCWVAGASAVVNPLVLSRREVLFMFPAMFVLLFTALFLMRTDYKLTRSQGVAVLSLYVLYLLAFFVFFGPGAASGAGA